MDDFKEFNISLEGRTADVVETARGLELKVELGASCPLLHKPELCPLIACLNKSLSLAVLPWVLAKFILQLPNQNPGITMFPLPC